jgi:hypothetical protein
MEKGSWGCSMLPMKDRARARMQETRGMSVSRGADWEVRPGVSWFWPDLETKEETKSASLCCEVREGFGIWIGGRIRIRTRVLLIERLRLQW